ncbi:15_t:CDS:1, partial [Acaulospora morrowiae]
SQSEVLQSNLPNISTNKSQPSVQDIYKNDHSISIDLDFPILEDLEMCNTLNSYIYQEKKSKTNAPSSNNPDISFITITSQQHTNSVFL